MTGEEIENVEDVVLDDQAVHDLYLETWREMKIDPNAARRFLEEAGWVSERFRVK